MGNCRDSFFISEVKMERFRYWLKNVVLNNNVEVFVLCVVIIILVYKNLENDD